MVLKKYYLPVGLLVAGLFSLTLPAAGLALKGAGVIPLLVFVIFLINGWDFNFSNTKLNRKFYASFFACACISLLAGPIIGLLWTKLLHLDAFFTTGLIIIASVPVTLSSAIVLTDISGGNRAWALLLTIGLNSIGILTMPFMLKLTLGASGNTHIHPGGLILQLAILVLTPFLIGCTSRYAIKSSRPTAGFVNYIPSTCVILTVYIAFSAAKEIIINVPWSDYPAVFTGALGVHFMLMAMALVSSKLMKLGYAERNTVLFITSQKTLPIAISVITIISPGNTAVLIPGVVFYFGQLFLDSFIASHLNAGYYARLSCGEPITTLVK
jgi:solute carrier family 10 (sodium/bile acid cotransporter), member 7